MIKTEFSNCLPSLSSTPDKVFDRNEIEHGIKIGEKSGLKLIEPIDYTHLDKVVHWNETVLDYTFIFFVMKK
jgi:hypothetical protein